MYYVFLVDSAQFNLDLFPKRKEGWDYMFSDILKQNDQILSTYLVIHSCDQKNRMVTKYINEGSLCQDLLS